MHDSNAPREPEQHQPHETELPPGGQQLPDEQEADRDSGGDDILPMTPVMPLKPRGFRPRRVLVGVLLVIALAAVLSWLSPYVLPVRVVEGPLVQATSETGATVVWFTSRAVPTQFELFRDESTVTGFVETDGQRQSTRITGLQAGREYPYTIKAGARPLAQGKLITNKPAGAAFSFVVFGDSGNASQDQYRLAVQMVRVAPDFILHTGDLVYNRGARHDFDAKFFRPYAPLLARVPFWPCLGNHDVSAPDCGAPYRSVFALPDNGPGALVPKHNYWFDYASARIAVIDSNLPETALHDMVAPWLREVMHAAGDKWKFVAFHHPPYTGGKYAPNLGIQRTLAPVFDEERVDVVFNGHDHMYQRTLPLRAGQVVAPGQGVVYIVTAAGGAELYEPKPADQRPPYITFLDHLHHSFTAVKLDGQELELRQIGTAGETLDEWRTKRRQSSE
jgi:acid phosphatase type 7